MLRRARSRAPDLRQSDPIDWPRPVSCSKCVSQLRSMGGMDQLVLISNASMRVCDRSGKSGRGRVHGRWSSGQHEYWAGSGQKIEAPSPTVAPPEELD
jgi:hypothetical protein